MVDRVGPYEILEKIGVGGMGTVYRARNTLTGQIVALKVMRPEFSEDASFIRRFRREASIASSIESQNIVSFLEIGEENESPYIAMELIEGQSLSSLIRSSGPLPANQALDIAIQIAQALYAAHAKGVIHRDISPQNILITKDGIAKITDFGIARSESSATLTGTGTFMGKPTYAPPEVFNGDADTRSDIYSLGIVLFEMLSGRPPFVASNPLATMDMQMRQPPPKLQDLGVRAPIAIQQIIDKCLQKDPGQRFQTPREVLLALTRALQGESVADLTQILPAAGGSGNVPALPVAAGSGDRGPILYVIAGLAAAVAVIAVIAVTLALTSGNKSTNSPTVAPTVNVVQATTVAPTTTQPTTATPVPTVQQVILPPPPTLVSPGAGQQLQQPAFGACPNGAVTWNFSWQPSGSPTVTGYEITIRQPNGTSFRDDPVSATSYSVAFACNQFIGDDQLSNWVWQVRAINGAGGVGDWSGVSYFNVQSRNPCSSLGICTVIVGNFAGLRLRAAAGAKSDTDPPILWNGIDPGTKLTISGGPVLADGYIWWPVQVVAPPPGKPASGWVAEGQADGTQSWLSVAR